jgi:hypothetical protein
MSDFIPGLVVVFFLLLILGVTALLTICSQLGYLAEELKMLRFGKGRHAMGESCRTRRVALATRLLRPSIRGPVSHRMKTRPRITEATNDG